MITVVGIAGHSEHSKILEEFPSATYVCRSSKFDLSLPNSASYDELFETSDLARVPDVIAHDIIDRSSENDIVYLVPGRGIVGDSTVESLSKITDVFVYPNTLPLPQRGRLQIIDAIEIAAVEQKYPFDTGMLAIDPGTPLLVTNWTGTVVLELASKRLDRLYGSWSGVIQSDSELFVPALPTDYPSSSLSTLASLAAFLRTPAGCPWDREQTVESLLPALLEEVAEFDEAVQENDPNHQAEELGDVLMNVLMIAQVAHEDHLYSLDIVVHGVSEKIIRRHPHVFGDENTGSIDDIRAIWQRVKCEEQQISSVNSRGE